MPKLALDVGRTLPLLEQETGKGAAQTIGGRNLVLFGGRLRVGSPMELALTAGILLLSLVVQPCLLDHP
ncbi:MAG: hypothetical protein ACK4Z6_07165 [Candidatus Methylomirabilales bacterium]